MNYSAPSTSSMCFFVVGAATMLLLLEVTVSLGYIKLSPGNNNSPAGDNSDVNSKKVLNANVPEQTNARPVDTRLFAKAAWDAVHNKTLVAWKRVIASVQDIPGVPYNPIPGVDLYPIEGRVAAYKANKVLSTPEFANSKKVPVFVLSETDGFCSLLRARHRMKGKYIVAFFSASENYGFLGDEIWGTGPTSPWNLENAMRYCHPKLKTRAKVLAWLDQPTLVELWVNQGLFFAHRKLRMVPLGPKSVATTQQYLDLVPSKDALPERDQWLYINLIGDMKDPEYKPSDPRSHRQYIVDTLTANFPGLQNMYSSTPKSAASKREYSEALLRARFVVSPRGWGGDCFRHWEILLFGAIPLIEVSPTMSAFVGFPHVAVSDWKLITPQYLEAQYKEIMFAARQSPVGSVDLRAYQHLTVEYFRDRIKRLAADPEAAVV